MRALALLLALAVPAWAHADCRDAASSVSEDRSLSDAPYASSSQAAPCRRTGEPAGLTPHEGWTAERDPTRMQVARIGTFLVALGAAAMAVGGGFAICAHNDASAKNRSFCSNAETPTLISGGVVAGLGLGALTVSTFVLPEERASGHPSVAAGLKLRFEAPWAWAR